MSANPEELYRRIRHVIDTFPDLRKTAGTAECRQWLGMVFALTQIVDPSSRGEVGMYTDWLDENPAYQQDDDQWEQNQERARDGLETILYRNLAIAEMNAPSSAHGTFLAAGNVFDAMAAVQKLVGEAKNEILVVDPYLDSAILTDFLSRSPSVPIRLLADAAHVKSSLKPAVTRWNAQAASSTVDARLTAARALHDRLIMIDSSKVWLVSQSFNAIATRALASIALADAELADLKLQAYAGVWALASPL